MFYVLRTLNSNEFCGCWYLFLNLFTITSNLEFNLPIDLSWNFKSPRIKGGLKCVLKKRRKKGLPTCEWKIRSYLLSKNLQCLKESNFGRTLYISKLSTHSKSKIEGLFRMQWFKRFICHKVSEMLLEVILQKNEKGILKKWCRRNSGPKTVMP